MKKFIVITSIHPPSDGVRQFCEISEYGVIVIGDEKTPPDWQCDGVDFYNVERQQRLGFKTANVLPMNHYCRKMIGYLVANRREANVIVDTDDDNIPLANWGFPELNNEYEMTSPDMGYVNIYQLFTKMNIWPRGLPLDRIAVKNNFAECMRV